MLPCDRCRYGVRGIVFSRIDVRLFGRAGKLDAKMMPTCFSSGRIFMRSKFTSIPATTNPHSILFVVAMLVFLPLEDRNDGSTAVMLLLVVFHIFLLCFFIILQVVM
jgi:threonine/homoserine/homoserine lactone efflux protein